MVLNLVSSTLSCIRQPRPRLRVLDVFHTGSLASLSLAHSQFPGTCSATLPLYRLLRHSASGTRSSGTGGPFRRRSEASHPDASEQVVSLITWLSQCSGEAGVPSGRRTQSKEPLFQRGDVCCTRQQTDDFCADPFLRSRQCDSCRRARVVWPNALRPARHGGRQVENFDSVAHGKRARRRGADNNCCEQRARQASRQLRRD